MLYAAAVLTQFEHVAEVFVGDEDRRLDPRLFEVVDKGEVGHVGGVVQFLHRPVLHVDVVDDGGRGGDQLDVIFALDPVADDFEVQKAQKAAAEAETEGGGGFHLEREAGVVEGEFFDAVAQVFEIVGVDGEEAAEDDRLRGFEARQRGGAGLFLVGDGVADAGVADLLDGGGQEADLAGAERVDFGHRGAEDADAVDVVDRAVLHHADTVAFLELPVHDAHEDDHAEVAVVPRIDQHRLERRVERAGGRGEVVDDGLEGLNDPLPRLGGDADGAGGVDADDVLDLFSDAVAIGGGQVDLVEDRYDLVVRVDGMIDVGERLRLDALGAVDHQKRAFDRAHGAGDLVGEIDVTGGVDQVEHILLAIQGGVVDPDGLRLDRDAALALDVHAVEHLLFHVAQGHGVRLLDKTIGEGGFPVVDVRDDGEIADV